MNLTIFFAKILNRLNLLKFFNLNVSFRFQDRIYKIPILKKIGFEHIYMFRDYDFELYSFFREKILQGTFLDIGANTGQTILKVNALNDRNTIVSVEPNPNCQAYLIELKGINDLTNVSIIPAAIFDSVGIKKLYILKNVDTGASLITSNREDYFNQEVFYYVNSIDGSVLQGILKEKISFIKIDVEGAELNVMKTLQALIHKDKPHIYCEVLDAHSETAIVDNDRVKREIFQFVTEDLQYEIYQFDNVQKNVVKIKAFPSRAYSSRLSDQCNYIFVPVH